MEGIMNILIGIMVMYFAICCVYIVGLCIYIHVLNEQSRVKVHLPVDSLQLNNNQIK